MCITQLRTVLSRAVEAGRYLRELFQMVRQVTGDKTLMQTDGRLEHGGGKTLDLKECPRQQLESEVGQLEYKLIRWLVRVSESHTYLPSSASGRTFTRRLHSAHCVFVGLNYLVTIDNTGKLRWARNGQLVDTTAGRWKDAGDGRGIVPLEQRTASPTIQPRHSFTAPATSFASSSSTSVSGDEVSAMMHYVGIRQQTKNPIKRLLLRNFTLRGLLEKLLRKTVRRNTWIYVSVGVSGVFC